MNTARVTRALAEFAAGITFEQIPADIRALAKIHILNVLACGLRGRSLESARIVIETHSEMGGRPEAIVLGEGMQLSAPVAAALNAHAAYCTQCDDTFFEGTLHPGHAAVPAALAVCEREKEGGRELITAVVTGFEVGCRVGASICHSQDAHKGRIGWHCNISDSFVALGATGKVIGLDADQFVAGLGIAATSSCGLASVMNPPPSYVWPWDGGLNTYSGVLGGYLAQRGMTAGTSALEAPNGYIQMFTEHRASQAAYDRAVRGLGVEWHTAQIAIKTRCASYMMHCAINAAQRAFLASRVDPEEIATISVRTNHWTAGRLMHQTYTDYNSTLFSLPFAIAVALLDGGELTLPDQHIAHLKDPRIGPLMKKVEAVVDPGIDRLFGAQMPAIVSLKTKSGQEFEEREDLPLGKYPDKPLSPEQLMAKVYGNACHSLETEQVDRLCSLVWNLESLEDLSELARLVGKLQ